jgi:cell division protein FtsB
LSSKNPAPYDSFRPVLGAAVGLFVALLGIASLKSYRDLESARTRERLLETRIEETTSRIEHLRVRIARLRTDPGTLERLAREDLGMVRPGDVIIELPLDPAAGPQRAPLVPPGTGPLAAPVPMPTTVIPRAPATVSNPAVIPEAGSAAPPAPHPPGAAQPPAAAAAPPAPGLL